MLPDCESGFEYDLKSQMCIDVDECKSPDTCSKSNEYCVNSVGSYSCSKCQIGYRLQEPFNVCRDVNECEDGPNPCLAGQTCMNIPGSFKCFCQVNLTNLFN